MFNIWKRKFDRRINSYELKNKAVELIWQTKLRDSNIELKRSFSIWKELLHDFHYKKDRVKKLILNCYSKRLSTAFSIWQNHSTNLNA
jgi:hypothetical protein